MKQNNKKGFTLVEIMIVVALIGLIATMAIPAFQKVRESSQDKTIIYNLRQIQAHAEDYFMEHPDLESVNVTNLIWLGREKESALKKAEPVRGEIYPHVVNRGEVFVSLLSDTEASHRKGKGLLNSSGDRD